VEIKQLDVFFYKWLIERIQEEAAASRGAALLYFWFWISWQKLQLQLMALNTLILHDPRCAAIQKTPTKDRNQNNQEQIHRLWIIPAEFTEKLPQNMKINWTEYLIILPLSLPLAVQARMWSSAAWESLLASLSLGFSVQPRCSLFVLVSHLTSSLQKINHNHTSPPKIALPTSPALPLCWHFDWLFACLSSLLTDWFTGWPITPHVHELIGRSSQES